RLADNLSYFYLRTHHVICDGYGANSFIRHIAAVYSGAVADTGEVDFSGVSVLRGGGRGDQESSRSRVDAEYWQSVVGGLAEVSDLAGMQRLVAPRHPRVRELVCTRRVSRNGYGQFDVARVVAALAVFIAKTTGRQDVSLSLPVSARTTAVLKRCAGMVSNLGPLLICVDEADTIGALTDRLAKALLGARRHQQCRP